MLLSRRGRGVPCSPWRKHTSFLLFSEREEGRQSTRDVGGQRQVETRERRDTTLGETLRCCPQRSLSSCSSFSVNRTSSFASSRPPQIQATSVLSGSSTPAALPPVVFLPQSPGFLSSPSCYSPPSFLLSHSFLSLYPLRSASSPLPSLRASSFQCPASSFTSISQGTRRNFPGGVGGGGLFEGRFSSSGPFLSSHARTALYATGGSSTSPFSYSPSSAFQDLLHRLEEEERQERRQKWRRGRISDSSSSGAELSPEGSREGEELSSSFSPSPPSGDGGHKRTQPTTEPPTTTQRVLLQHVSFELCFPWHRSSAIHPPREASVVPLRRLSSSFSAAPLPRFSFARFSGGLRFACH